MVHHTAQSQAIYNSQLSHVYSTLSTGCLATAGALTYGLVMFKRGNTAKSQTMMRARVAAQGLTIVAIVVGVAMGAGRPTYNTPGPK